MKRLILPDLLKGLAGLFMVQVHITELFINQTGQESVFGEISLFLGGPFAAVVFMLVMGYFIAKSKDTFGLNAMRGLKIFILGLLLNIGINFHLFLKIKFAGWPYNPLEYLLGVDILYLAGISIIVLSILKLFETGQQLASLVLILAVAALTGVMNEKLTITDHYYILPFIAGTYSWSYFPLFPWLLYPLTGFALAKYEEKIKLFFNRRKTVSVVIISLSAAFVMLFYKQGIEITTNLPAYYHHTGGYFLWALGLTLLWMLFVQVLLELSSDNIVVKFFCWIGKNITLFYVVQWIIIGNISTALYQTQSTHQYGYWFAGVFTASVGVTFLVEKSRTRVLSKSRKQ